MSEDSISYPSDPELADELESSLHSQLKLDIREAITELGIVCAFDEKLLLRSVDAGPLREAGDEFSIEDITPSMAGLVHLAHALDFSDED